MKLGGILHYSANVCQPVITRFLEINLEDRLKDFRGSILNHADFRQQEIVREIARDRIKIQEKFLIVN